MKITKQQRLAAAAIKKSLAGIIIDNEELTAGLAVLRKIVPALYAFGERYHLAATDLNMRLSDFEYISHSRKRKII